MGIWKTYFIAGDRPLPGAIQDKIDKDEYDVCTNLTFLGKEGVMNTLSGLSIAYVSGAEKEEEEEMVTGEAGGKAYHRLDKATEERMRRRPFKMVDPPGVDILLTYQWPEGIERGSQLIKSPPANASSAVSRIAAALKPRFHFAAAEAKQIQREPYLNVTGYGPPDERTAAYPTQFVGLGEVGKKTQKWYHITSLTPLRALGHGEWDKDEGELKKPDTTTACPFTEEAAASSAASKKRKLEDPNAGNYFFGGLPHETASKRQAVDRTNQCLICGKDSHVTSECKKKLHPDYVCKICNERGHSVRFCPNDSTKAQSRGRTGPPDTYVCKICNEPGHYIKDCPRKTEEKLKTCWFCLSNPQADKHLVVSIGTEMYAAMAKGPVVSGEDSGSVPGGGHVILVPITHYGTLSDIAPETKEKVDNEISQYINALRKFYADHQHDMVVFEICRKSQGNMGHAHIQVIPVPKDKSGLLEDILNKEAEKANYKLHTDRPNMSPYDSFFKIDLPGGSYYHIIHPKERFNLQFGRLVVATALGHPERENWDTNRQTHEQEVKGALDFKTAFRRYDPSL
ncbi:CwfJ C-terminus 1-domain-containing protein-like protein [Dichotomocladium elegans]|nr:CwfJ C-terminus 1-domain-containing protein-like protein [Dichotomocladium elegans]